MLFLKQLVKLLVLFSADLLHRTSHTKTFLLCAIFYLLIQCLFKVLSLHCIVSMSMFLSPVTSSFSAIFSVIFVKKSESDLCLCVDYYCHR